MSGDMGILGRVFKQLFWKSTAASSSDVVSRCLYCEAEFEKEYRECPRCGRQYVGLVDPDDADQPGT